MVSACSCNATNPRWLLNVCCVLQVGLHFMFEERVIYQGLGKEGALAKNKSHCKVSKYREDSCVS